jgi:hypothetical protein
MSKPNELFLPEPQLPVRHSRYRYPLTKLTGCCCSTSSLLPLLSKSTTPSSSTSTHRSLLHRLSSTDIILGDGTARPPYDRVPVLAASIGQSWTAHLSVCRCRRNVPFDDACGATDTGRERGRVNQSAAFSLHIASSESLT